MRMLIPPRTHYYSAFLLFVFEFLLCFQSIYPLQEGKIRKKCLILSIDNRQLLKNYDANHYPSMTAILNHEYAEYQGYDFIYYQNDLTNFVEDTMKKYPNAVKDPMMLSNQPDKDIATAFHVGLKQFRAASWAKLPPLWYINQLYKDKYDYIWYIDSDAAISPRFLNRSIHDMVDLWNSDPSKYILQGQTDLTKASLIFFNNFPWRDNMPCAGSFIFRPSEFMDNVFRQWWDYDLPMKNFKHFHEQDALWHMIESEGSRKMEGKTAFYINSQTYSIMKELQFPSVWTRYEDLWLVHIASYNYAYRMPVLYQFLHLVGKGTSESYYLAVEHILESHKTFLKPLPQCEEMEQLSLDSSKNLIANRITDFPKHDEKNQNAWYDEHVSSANVPSLSMGKLYEGRIIRRKGEFWIVQNEQKRGFQNYQVFLNMKMREEWAHHMRVQDVSQIPDGPLLTTSLTPEDIKTLLKNYQPLPVQLPKISVPNSISSSSAIDSKYFPYVYHDFSPANANKLFQKENTKIMLFIISHNNETESLVKQYLQSFSSEKNSWIYSTQITSSVFFESIVYQTVFPFFEKEYLSKEYVITATYKTLTRSLHYNSYQQTINQILDMLIIAKQGSYDILPFLRSGSGLISFCTYWHGNNFKIAWYELLKGLGYPTEVIQKYEEIKPFYRNIFIIKPLVLKDLQLFMLKAIQLVKQRKDIYQLLSKDSNYKEGKEEVALRIFGTKYYQLFPFIFERLPSFFIAANNYKICADTIGPCKYNS